MIAEERKVGQVSKMLKVLGMEIRTSGDAFRVTRKVTKTG
jgi:hypothetical protein